MHSFLLWLEAKWATKEVLGTEGMRQNIMCHSFPLPLLSSATAWLPFVSAIGWTRRTLVSWEQSEQRTGWKSMMVWNTQNLWPQMTDMFVFRWKPTVVVGITSQTTMRSAEALFKKKLIIKFWTRTVEVWSILTKQHPPQLMFPLQLTVGFNMQKCWKQLIQAAF